MTAGFRTVVIKRAESKPRDPRTMRLYRLASYQLTLTRNRLSAIGMRDSIYERTRNLREDKDLTQKELAAQLGMSQTGYSKYETDIPTAILIALSCVYNTSIDYLLGLTDERKPYQRKR